MGISMLILIVMTSIGLIFGLILAYGNKKFSMEVNPLIHLVEDVLPKGQCGACGFAGCLAYAEAVVLNPDVSPSLCTPGKDKVAQRVAELTGKNADAVEVKVAQVMCGCSSKMAYLKYEYNGVSDCEAAFLVLGGPKACKYGCLGLGSCVKYCPFDAITMSEDGLPLFDHELCTGCGKCIDHCPKKVITLQNPHVLVQLNCSSQDKGASAKKVCTVACIGCGLCSKDCQYEAITMKNNLPVIDDKICLEKCHSATCLLRCPTGAIKLAMPEN